MAGLDEALLERAAAFDAWGVHDQAANIMRRAATENKQLRQAAEQAQRTLALLLDPGSQAATSSITAFAQVVEAEAKLRAALKMQPTN